MAKRITENEELYGMRDLLTDLAPLYSASVETVAEALGITARHVQRLVLEGTLPAPSRHGCYNLAACIRAWGLQRRGVEIPTSVAAALVRFAEARDVLEECIRRHPEQRPANYTTPAAALWPIGPLEPMLGPQRFNPRAVSSAAVCAVTGLAWWAFEAAFPRSRSAA